MSAPAEKKALAETRPPLNEVTPLPKLERPPEGSAKAAAEANRRRRSRRLILRIALFVVVPTIVAAVYFCFVATEQYESYSLFTVQSSELKQGLGGVESLLAGISVGGGGHDALTVRDYVLSRDMLTRLDKDLGFIAHYKTKDRDFIARLRSTASFEDAYEYFGSKVYADFDQTTGAVTLRVRAFSADKAVALSQAILSYSEEMVNKLSERQRSDRIAYAEADLTKAEARLAKARKDIVALQEKYGEFNPLKSAGAAMEIRTVLEGELARSRAELMMLKSYMRDDSPQVMAANEKVNAISAQVKGENRRLINPNGDHGINDSLIDFEAAMGEKEFSEKVYHSTLATLEIARADAGRQHRYLAVIAKPSKPDVSTYPYKGRSVLAAFVLSFLLFGIFSLMGAAVREHAQL